MGLRSKNHVVFFAEERNEGEFAPLFSDRARMGLNALEAYGETPQIEADFESLPNEAGTSSTFTPAPADSGRATAKVTIPMALKGSGDSKREPGWARPLQVCGFRRENVYPLQRLSVTGLAYPDRFFIGDRLVAVDTSEDGPVPNPTFPASGLGNVHAAAGSESIGIVVGFIRDGGGAGTHYVYVWPTFKLDGTQHKFAVSDDVLGASNAVVGAVTAAVDDHGILYRPSSIRTVRIYLDKAPSALVGPLYEGRQLFFVNAGDTISNHGTVVVRKFENTPVPSFEVSLHYGVIRGGDELFDATTSAYVHQDFPTNSIRSLVGTGFPDTDVASFTAGATTTVTLSEAHGFANGTVLPVTFANVVASNSAVQDQLNLTTLAGTITGATTFTLAVDTTGVTFTAPGKAAARTVIQESGRSATIVSNLDTKERRLLGGRGTVSGSGDAGAPFTLNFEIDGLFGGAYSALPPEVIRYGDVAQRPPRLVNPSPNQDGSVWLSGFKQRVKGFGFEFGSSIDQPRDANGLDGVGPTTLFGREPSMSYRAETAGASGFPYEATTQNKSQQFCSMQIGSAEGNLVSIVNHHGQLTAIPESDDNGTTITDASLNAVAWPDLYNSSGDHEILICHL